MLIAVYIFLAIICTLVWKLNDGNNDCVDFLSLIGIVAFWTATLVIQSYSSP